MDGNGGFHIRLRNGGGHMNVPIKEWIDIQVDVVGSNGGNIDLDSLEELLWTMYRAGWSGEEQMKKPDIMGM